MSSLRSAISLVTALAAAAFATQAAGQDVDEPSKLYAGVGLGVGDFQSDHAGIGYSDTAVGWQLYGGLQARKGKAVEIAVERLAGIESGDIRGSGVERLRISAVNSSISVRGVFSLSLQDVLQRQQPISVFGTVGLAQLREQRDVLELTTSRATSVTERDTSLVLGVGVMFDVARVRVRTYFQAVDRADGDLYSLGAAAELRF